MTRITLLVFTLQFLSSCQPPEQSKLPPSPSPEGDVFNQMCNHLVELGCPEGGSVYNDNLPGEIDVPNQSCSEFYRSLQRDGIPVNAECVSKTPSCAKIETYRQKKAPECR